jgi:hypothetical protein
MLALPDNCGMNTPATQIIDALGGTSAVAKLFEISKPSVSDWRRKGIPKARAMLLRAIKQKELVGLDLLAATAPVRGEGSGQGAGV